MSVWGSYARRLDGRCLTDRGRILANEKSVLARKLPYSLSYHHAVIDGEERQLAIINSDNLDIKTMCSWPGEDIRHGALVEWMDNKWLVIEKDANNEVYARAKMQQCNYLLRWVNQDGKIVERWSIVDDGTKLKRMNVRNSLVHWKRCAKRTPLIAGNSLEPCNRNGAANSRIWNGLKTAWIGQSAAKPRTEEGSTTIPEAGVHTRVWKRGALNCESSMVKIWSAPGRNVRMRVMALDLR